MEDRIEINGVWYVKEQPESTIEEKKEIDIYEDLIFTRDCLYSENGLELTYSVLDDEGTMTMPSLKIVKGDFKDEWDNKKFLLGVIQNDEYSQEVIVQEMRGGMKLTFDDIKIIRQMLIHISNKGLI